MLLPNHLLHPLFGKFLFIAADILTAYLLAQLLAMILPAKTNLAPYLALWLFNPFVFVVSTRGNAEALLGAMVLGVLHLLFHSHTILAGLLFGVAVSFKIYPILYSLPIWLYLAKSPNPPLRRLFTFSRDQLKFATATIAAVSALTLLCFWIYGDEFLQETYFYHIVRKDHRHNFSLFFYGIYLSTFEGGGEGNSVATVLGYVCLIPQAILMLLFSFSYSRTKQRLCTCLWLQTLAFVAFNKVCTSQYFVWYFAVLPLAACQFRWTRASTKRFVACIALWAVAQALWLQFAFRLEFRGEQTFVALWISSCLLFCSNMWMLVLSMEHNK
eukprot:TRINITY_DN6091_c0_g1_i1.p1 TRINITY_DN6091_c0_g1~~TRINITY_DN6091_c0_g1_i1.p1  ORF type:complete len:328 (-),score=29.74 TRINITY_DN6091_c0_g1_i1:91-1074(-)